MVLGTDLILRLYRTFNTGSPYNVPAGHTADLSALRAHYQQKNLEKEEEQMAKVTARAGESAILAQRRQAEDEQSSRPISMSSILESVGLKRPDK